MQKHKRLISTNVLDRRAFVNPIGRNVHQSLVRVKVNDEKTDKTLRGSVILSKMSNHNRDYESDYALNFEAFAWQLPENIASFDAYERENHGPRYGRDIYQFSTDSISMSEMVSELQKKSHYLYL